MIATMKKIIIRVGGDMVKDAKNIWDNPRAANWGTYTIYVKNFDEVSKLLTPKRLHLLYEMVRDVERLTVCELAEKTNRKQEAVSRDLSALAEHHLVRKTRHKQATYVEAPFRQIVIEFANA